MKHILTFILLGFSHLAGATTYYVSSSSGSDSSGGSLSAPWQTIAHVNGQTFQPGDSVLFKRGDVWNESLAPASSGNSGNPITFDAYGAGAAPNLTGYYAVPATSWVLVTGNAWKAALPATYTSINFCLFGSVWGQKVAAATSNLAAKGNFYLANGYIYIFSSGSPSSFYNEPIVPMALSNAPVIDVNGQSWLTFQHFLLNWFDEYGVYVQGNSDHLVFANMEADSMIPQGTQPLGFYVNESAPGPGDIKIYNSEAHLNYDAFRFDSAATAITMVNDKAYGNRDGALVDNTSAVSYSYCHFYASSLAVAGSTDVEYTSGTGPIGGAGNIPVDTPPTVQAYRRYPAEVTLTVDDEGMTAGADTYYANTVLPIADAAGVPVGAAITVGYPLAQTLIPAFQGWINEGRDVTSHSISHTYYTNTDALEVQYTGTGTAATLSISNKTLTITVTGASDSVSYNLGQGEAEGTIKLLRLALLATGKFSATEIQTCQGPYGTGCSFNTESALLGQDLADVSSVDVKSSVYHMQLDVTRLTTDEITLSRNWMTTNLTGLAPTPVYVYPGGYETTAMQAITEGVPYAGARGALKEDLGVKDTYADGFNVENITSFGVNPSWMGLPAASLNQKVQALVWKESLWGVPWGIFWHFNATTGAGELSATEVTNLIAYLQASGATIKTNTGLVNWLLGGTQGTGTDGNDYYTFPATSTVVDFRPTKSSPVVNAGQNLGAAYALDLNGVNQNSYGSGWEIGAHVYQGYSTYGGGQGGSHFTVGEGTLTQTLTVSVSGAIGGSITDSQGGISGCTSTCSAGYPQGTVDYLTVTPNTGWYLGEWTGSCAAGSPISPTDGCSVTMSAAHAVTAVFGNSNNAPPAYSGSNSNSTGTAIVQPTATSMGGLIGAGTCQIPSDFSYPICRLTDASWDSSYPAATITGISESGTTVTVTTNLNPGSCNASLQACVNISGLAAPYNVYNGIVNPVTSSATSFTFTATSSGLPTCSAACGTASLITATSLRFETTDNSLYHAIGCPSSSPYPKTYMVFFVNEGGFGYVGGLNASSYPYTLTPVFPSNSGWSAHGDWRAAVNGEWSRNCVYSPNLFYGKNTTTQSTMLTSYDFTGWALNPTGAPVQNTIFNFAAGQTSNFGTTSTNCLPASAGTTAPNWTDWGGTTKNPPDAEMEVSFGIQQVIAYGAITFNVTNGSHVFTVASGGPLNIDGTDDMIWIDLGCNALTCPYSVQCVTGEASCYGGGGTSGMGGLLTTPWNGATGTESVRLSGGQDFASWAAVYFPGKGCAVLNTATGIVTADAATGVATGATALAPSGGLPNGFYLHGARLTPDGQYVDMSFDYCVPGAPANCVNGMGYMWQLTASAVADAVFPMCENSSGHCGGHKANGYKDVVNPASLVSENYIRSYAFNMATASPAQYLANSTVFSPCGAAGSDSHVNWVNVDTNDTYPWFVSTTTYGQTAQVPGSYNCGGIDEIFAVTPPANYEANPGTGTLYRFAHTMITGLSSDYQIGNSMEQCSDDGLFCIFSSDWSNNGVPSQLGTLGPSDLGTETCNPVSGTNMCRGDVFVVGLQQ